jgi:uncharacterized protein
MTIRRERLIDRKNVSDEVKIITVERHPRNKLSVWLIVIFILIITVFGYLSDDGHEIKIQIDSSSGQNNSPDNGKQNIFSTPNIHQLIARADVAALKKHLLTIEDEVINEVVDGMTPIMVAASLGNVEIIDMLFTQGADPNKRGSMERTALQYATEKNHIEAAKRLLAYGADIDAHDNGYITPLIMAANRGYTELGLIYVNKGADVNIQHSQGWTALIDAVIRNDVILVKALLKAGADKEIAGKNGMRAIDFARQYGHKNMVEILDKPGRIIDVNKEAIKKR